jgi:hypothetical protein
MRLNIRHPLKLHSTQPYRTLHKTVLVDVERHPTLLRLELTTINIAIPKSEAA